MSEDLNKELFDVVIVGAGPAGGTAAIFAGVYKLKNLVIARDYGIALGAHEMLNYPGFQSISGLDLVKKIREHATKVFGARILEKEVIKITGSIGNFELETADGKKFFAKNVILATGLQNRKLGLVNEDKFIGKGVSYCATCDAASFKNKIVGVIGGSDSAAQAALLLSEYAERVFIFYRKEALRAQPVLVEKVKASKKIKVWFNSRVVEVYGKDFLEEVVVEKNDGKSKERMKLNGLFVEIGGIPQTVLLGSLNLEKDNAGFLIVDKTQKTSLEGFYAAGDITATHSGFKQVITACAEGAAAVHYVFKKIQEEAKK